MRSRLLALILLAVLIVDAGVVAAAPAPVVSRVSTTSKVIALTFDDGYSPQRCLEIYDTLVEFDIPATWFPNAVYMDSNPDVWKKIAARFPIANHTTHHKSLPSLSNKQIREEILSQERRVQSITGRPGQKILRPPYGAYDERVRREAGNLGYTSIALWDVSSADTSQRAADRAIAQRTLSGRPGSIILLHCGPAVTPRILPIVIARYACKGFRFATVEGLLAGEPGVEAKVTCPPPPLPARRNGRDPKKASAKPPGVKVAPQEPGTTEPASNEGSNGQSAADQDPGAANIGEAARDEVWHLVELRSDEALEPVPAEVEITLQFGSQGASGAIGCDLYSTSTKMRANGALKLGRIRRSSEGCEADDQGWVDRYLQTLSGVSGQSVADGRLELLGDDRQILLGFVKGTPTHVLGEWSATSVADANGELVAVSEAAPISASFGATGTLRGSTPCSRYLSGYATRADTITIGPVLATESTCASDEDAFIAGLGSATTWAIRDGILELRDADGRVVIQLEPFTPVS